MENKLLSIVIPTIGNRELLKVTLASLLPQVEIHQENVEIILSLNGAKDGTDSLVVDLAKKYQFIKYKIFSDRVDIIPSFVRSVSMTSGKYIIIFGDDDIIFPHGIDKILELIIDNPLVAIFHYNVLSCKDKGDGKLCRATVENTSLDTISGIMPISEFLKYYAVSGGFISSVVFKREVWDRGLLCDYKDNLGYGQIMIIYNGAKDKSCFYYNLPLVVKRVPYKRSWLSKWPYFWLIDIPLLMQKIDNNNISTGIFDLWNARENKSMIKYCYTLLNASAYKQTYKPLCHRINSFQRSKIRKLLTYLIIYATPSCFFSFFRHLVYKNIN